jgi:insertion element IS1 protein InsB
VVADAIGDRSQATCQKLWAAIPEALPPRLLLQRLLGGVPAGHPCGAAHRCGKESGLTAQVERWNNTWRQWLGRFVRKSLSFSKSDTMHELCLRLFLHDYNQSLALSFD